MSYSSLRATAIAVLLLFLCLASSRVCAEILTFKDILAAGLQNSFDSKIIREEIGAAQATVAERQADYYPQLSLRFGNEYVHVFDEDGDIVSVGDAIIADNASGYKHSLIATARYNLYDFGIRELSVASARRQVHIAELQKQQSSLDIHKELLTLYADSLKVQQRIRVIEVIAERQQTIFQLSKKLHQAGTLGREQLGNAALELAETLSQLEDLQTRWQNLLENLSFHTQENYHAEDVTLADFPQREKPEHVVNLESFPEVLIYQQQIETKQTELSMLKRSLLPRLTLSGSYRMFGSDDHSFTDSLSNLNSRDASMTLYLECPIFDGFANRAKQTRTRHELASLRYRKQKKQAELQQELSTTLNTYTASASMEGERRKQLKRIAGQRSDVQRLAEQQLTDRIAVHNHMIELSRRQLDVDLRQVDYAASALLLALMNEVGS
ncbi:MAG: TolC family protein [Thermodesulfobacteriota bacterium]|nr:TolC family protein [Thermodesulfobacteriota bacterium]